METGHSPVPQPQPNPDTNELVTVLETAKRLRISVWKVNQLIWSRQLESIKIGRRRLVPGKAIEAYIERLRQEESF